MKKKVLFAAFALLAVVLPQNAMARYYTAIAPSGQRLYYQAYNGRASVCEPESGWTEETRPTGDLIIPSTVNFGGSQTYTVWDIGGFHDCSGLTSVSIPNSVTRIGNQAFSGCSGLVSINIPDSVTEIGWGAFSGCSSLTNITIPSSVTTIGFFSILEGCSGLTSIVVDSGNTVYDSRNNCNAIIETATNTLISGTHISTIPNSISIIGRGAFSSDSLLTTITIPNSVTSIGRQAFLGCTNLTNIDIPNSVTSIGESAFYGCTNLSDITIPNSVTQIGEFAFARSGLSNISIPNSVTQIGMNAFLECSSLTSIDIPGSVTIIETYVFKGCSGLTSVTIGSGVEEIHEAFPECSHIEQITCKAVIPPSVRRRLVSNNDDYAFYQVSRNIPLYVPQGSIESYRTAHVWSTFTNYQPINTEGIGDVDGSNAKVYSADGGIVVDGADGKTVTLYDAAGHQLAVRCNEYDDIRFDIPASGTYLVKVGDAPARRIVVVR